MIEHLVLYTTLHYACIGKTFLLQVYMGPVGWQNHTKDRTNLVTLFTYFQSRPIEKEVKKE
jgi:hypothetical protein